MKSFGISIPDDAIIDKIVFDPPHPERDKRAKRFEAPCKLWIYGKGQKTLGTTIAIEIHPEVWREQLLQDVLIEYVGPSQEVWACAFPAPCLPQED
jgi:hypothetical protein